MNPQFGIQSLFVAVGAVLIVTIMAVSVQTLQNRVDLNSRAAGIACGSGTCKDGWGYGQDCNAPQSSCSQRAAEACSSHGGTASGGGGITCSTTQPTPTGGVGAMCDGASQTAVSCRNQPVGKVITNTGSGSNSCTCTRTTGTLCACTDPLYCTSDAQCTGGQRCNTTARACYTPTTPTPTPGTGGNPVCSGPCLSLPNSCPVGFSSQADSTCASTPNIRCCPPTSLNNCYYLSTSCLLTSQSAACNETTNFASLTTCQQRLATSATCYDISQNCAIVHVASCNGSTTFLSQSLCTAAQKTCYDKYNDCSQTKRASCDGGIFFDSREGCVASLVMCYDKRTNCTWKKVAYCDGTNLLSSYSLCAAAAGIVTSCSQIDTSTACAASSLGCMWKAKSGSQPVDMCLPKSGTGTPTPTPLPGYEACCVNGVDANVQFGRCGTASLANSVKGTCASQAVTQLSSCTATCPSTSANGCNCPGGCVKSGKVSASLTCGGNQPVTCCVDGVTKSVQPGECSGAGRYPGTCNVNVNLASCITPCTSSTGCFCPSGCKQYQVSSGQTCGGSNAVACCINGVPSTVPPDQCTSVGRYLGSCDPFRNLANCWQTCTVGTGKSCLCPSGCKNTIALNGNSCDATVVATTPTPTPTPTTPSTAVPADPSICSVTSPTYDAAARACLVYVKN